MCCASVDGEGVLHQPNAIARSLARAVNPKLLGTGPLDEAEVRKHASVPGPCGRCRGDHAKGVLHLTAVIPWRRGGLRVSDILTFEAPYLCARFHLCGNV